MNYRYIYPSLPARYDFLLFRVGGFGLANCLFVYGRALVLSKKNNLVILPPTWLNFSLGPYLRSERDKRHYSGLFSWSLLKEIQKMYILILFPGRVLEIKGIGTYFDILRGESVNIKNSLYSLIHPSVKFKLEQRINEKTIGIHVRLGDYPQNRRTNIDWYIEVIKKINNIENNLIYSFLIFTDGNEDDILPLLVSDRVSLVQGQTALEDIWALSLCKLIVASDSTFSAWGSFLGQVPIVFKSRHFSSFLDNPDYEIVIGDDFDLLSPFLDLVLK